MSGRGDLRSWLRLRRELSCWRADVWAGKYIVSKVVSQDSQCGVMVSWMDALGSRRHHKRF